MTIGPKPTGQGEAEVDLSALSPRGQLQLRNVSRFHCSFIMSSVKGELGGCYTVAKTFHIRDGQTGELLLLS